MNYAIDAFLIALSTYVFIQEWIEFGRRRRRRETMWRTKR